MKKTSYIGKNMNDLVKALGEKRAALRDARFGSAGARARNVKETRNVRKDIARIMTELTKEKTQ
jgi:ribosomal protein L29